jgi:hypothetical protein
VEDLASGAGAVTVFLHPAQASKAQIKSVFFISSKKHG